MSTITEIRQIVENAENEIERALYVVPDMVKVVKGKLKVASKYANYSYMCHLAQLKKELENFNAHTKQWKE